jgi:hypothetical protein
VKLTLGLTLKYSILLSQVHLLPVSISFVTIYKIVCPKSVQEARLKSVNYNKPQACEQHALEHKNKDQHLA